MQTVLASRVGVLAAQLLGRDGSSAKVVSSVAGAMYLRTSSGEFFWVLPDGGSLHRRAILAPLYELNWPVGATGVVREGALCVAGSEALGLGGAPIWREPAPRNARCAQDEVLLRLPVALRLLLMRAEPKGLARRWSMAHSAYRERRSLQAIAWAEAGEEAVRVAEEACRLRDPEGLVRATNGLAGLGPGLTPSGDDFLGGLLFALRFFGSATGQAWLDGAAVEEVLEAARVRTHALSFAILSDLAHGHGPRPLHDLVCGAVAGERAEQLADHCIELTQIGHSSGWDVLTGVAAGGCAPLPDLVCGSREQGSWMWQEIRTTCPAMALAAG